VSKIRISHPAQHPLPEPVPVSDARLHFKSCLTMQKIFIQGNHCLCVAKPKLKKKVSAFLLGEDGRITKQAVMIAGAVLAAGALSAKNANAGCCDVTGTNTVPGHCWNHSNGVTAPSGPQVGHDHHYNHGSHASHASHGSHGSGGGMM